MTFIVRKDGFPCANIDAEDLLQARIKFEAAFVHKQLTYRGQRGEVAQYFTPNHHAYDLYPKHLDIMPHSSLVK